MVGMPARHSYRRADRGQAIDVGDVVINKDVFDGLTPAQQAIIEVAAKASVIESLTYFIQQNSIALTTLINEHGVQLFTPPEEYPQQFLTAANNAIDRRTGENEFFKKVVDSMRGFAKDAVPYRVETIKQSLFMGEAGLQIRQ
jgi:TRAP-type mannitol/chloroaromatic compound transport system substrate-binding protein